MKKLLAALMILTVLLSFAACMNGDVQQTQPTEATEPQSTLPPEGNKVGNRCPGYELPVVTADGDTGETVNPAETGKVTVINFWGVWCGPCVGELPHLNELAENYADTVTVIAVHSVQDQKRMPKFLKEGYTDSAIVFSWEQSEDFNGEYYLMLGGEGYYPYTVVLDANGIMTETKVGAMSYEEMQAMVENAGA